MGTSMGYIYIYLAAIKHGHHHGIPRLLVTGGIRIDGENTVDSYLYMCMHHFMLLFITNLGLERAVFSL